MAEPQFVQGTEVEVCSDEAGLKGVWFAATVLRSASKKKKKVYVEYKTLMASEKKGSKPLKEFVDEVNLRPLPPREANRSFQLSEDVDAYHNDGWWEGVVIKVVEGGRYSVYFRRGKEELEFGDDELRVHREWVNGSWVSPLEGEELKEPIKLEQPKQQEQPKKPEQPKKLVHKKKNKNNSTGLETEQSKESPTLEVKFKEGMHVEVSSDEEGFVGAWFSAKIIKAVGKNKFLVEYQTLRTDDESALLTEEADHMHIRPSPRKTPQVDSFRRLEEVDALYNDAWWVGVISKVLSNSRYYVYFRDNKEELEFDHSQLRVHQDWIGGKWVKSSEALML